MLLVVLKNVSCIVVDGLSKNVDFFIVRKIHFLHGEKTVYLEEVPLSNMLTMENNVKQIAPSPANTRAGMA